MNGLEQRMNRKKSRKNSKHDTTFISYRIETFIVSKFLKCHVSYMSRHHIMSCHLMLHHALCLVPWWIIRNWTKMMFSLANRIWSRNQIWFVLSAKSEFVSATFLFLLIFTTVWKFKMFKMFWSWASHLWRYSSQLQLSSCPYCWLVSLLVCWQKLERMALRIS